MDLLHFSSKRDWGRLKVKTSKVSKFYEKTLAERLQILKEFGELTDEEIALGNTARSSLRQRTG